MKSLTIVELGNKILRTKAKSFSAREIRSKSLQSFINKLIHTCDRSSGVGIAAPQVNIGKQLFILWSRTTKKRKGVPTLGPIAIINPKILSTSKKKVKGWEGCLSIPGIRGLVPRYEWIDVEFVTREGEKVRMTLESFPARIFQHEFDHLHGVVFLDRTNPKDLVTEREYQKIIKKSKQQRILGRVKIKNQK